MLVWLSYEIDLTAFHSANEELHLLGPASRFGSDEGLNRHGVLLGTDDMVALQTRPPEVLPRTELSTSIPHNTSHYGRLGLAGPSSPRLGRTAPLSSNARKRNGTIYNKRSLNLIEYINATPSAATSISETMERNGFANMAEIATLLDASQSFSTRCLNFVEKESTEDDRTTFENEGAEVDRRLDAQKMPEEGCKQPKLVECLPGSLILQEDLSLVVSEDEVAEVDSRDAYQKMPEENDDQPKQVECLPGSLSLHEDLSLVVSEDELRIIKNERLRRQKISKANKKTSRSTRKATVSDMELLIIEKQRRQRLSAALVGRTAWNKGKELSKEARQHIRERTMEAMKNPKVVAKLRGASMQSNETKAKIKASMVRSWEHRKKVKLVQEMCVEEWKEYVADSARRGFGGDISYSWNSYDALLKELQYAWKVQHQSRISRRKRSNTIQANRTEFNHGNSIKAVTNSNWGTKVSKQAKFREAYKTGEDFYKASGITVQACDHAENDQGSRSLKHSSMIMRPLKQQKMNESPYAYKDPSNIEKLERLIKIRAMRRLRQNSERMALKETDQRIAMERARILLGRVTLSLEGRAATDERALQSLPNAHELLAEAERLLNTAQLEDDGTA